MLASPVSTPKTLDHVFEMPDQQFHDQLHLLEISHAENWKVVDPVLQQLVQFWHAWLQGGQNLGLCVLVTHRQKGLLVGSL